MRDWVSNGGFGQHAAEIRSPGPVRKPLPAAGHSTENGYPRLMFDTLSDRLHNVFTSLRGKGRLTPADIDATAREIRIALLEADVALPVVRAFIANVKQRATAVEVSQALNPAQQVVKIVNEELIDILGGETRRLNLAKTGPTVILLAGLQGSGKTTLAGKLAFWLRNSGHTPLQVVGEQAGVPVYAPFPGNGVGDPVQAARDGVAEGVARHHDIVIVDTAGRLGVDTEMMAQAAAIRDAVQPDETLFVVDAMIGQDAVNTAEAFRDGVGFSGVVLTKLDGDARGGAALSVRYVTGSPILFASTGEKLKDFDVFHPERMASRILGMGDMLTLIEQAEQVFEADQAEEMALKMSGGDFTLDDFLAQMQQLKKMGPIGGILGMLPGAGQMKDQLANINDKDLDRTAAIIQSMTPQERADPKILNASRRNRIAKGSGHTVAQVSQLVERFYEARKMMVSMAGRFGMPGAKSATRRTAKGRKGKSGRGPTPPKLKGGIPRDLAGMLGQGPGALPPGFAGPSSGGSAGMPQLPPGFDFDPSKIKLPKN